MLHLGWPLWFVLALLALYVCFNLVESTGGEPQPAAHGAELMSVFDGLGDVMKPAVPPQASGASTIGASSPSKPMGDLDSTMANLAGNLAMGPAATTQVAPPSWGAPMHVPMGMPPYMGSFPNPGLCMSGASGAGAPMMPMVRPGFPPAGASGAPMSPGIMAQSPRRPPPPKNALDDLNIKDFM